MTHVKKIADDILKILILCTVEGFGIRINSGQLDRKTYDKVNDVLTLMGGNWNRAKRMHMFLESPAELLETVCATGEITNKKKQFQAFDTPPILVCKMIALADLQAGDNVLEPNAGTGRIAREISIRIRPEGVWMCELDHDKTAALIERFPGATIFRGDFLNLCFPETSAPYGGFQGIVMNPPFAGKQDIQHILHATTMLAPGGRLVAICANGPGRAEAFENLQAVRGGKFITDHWEELPAGTFRESGTDVRTILMRIRRLA